MDAFQFLRRRRVGTDTDGTPRFSSRSYRGFLIALLAGPRTVVLNADIRGGLDVRNAGGLIAGNVITGGPIRLKGQQ